MINENESMMDEGQVYEISYIFDNRLEEGKAAEKVETLKKDIASLGGSFISEETPYMRELSYEMTRVVNNVNVRFTTGYFGWVKFDLAQDKISDLDKKLKLDEEVVRFLIVKAEKGNDIFTKDLSIMKSDSTFFVKEEVVEDIEGVNVDTTSETDETIEENLSEDKEVLDKEVENI